MVKRRSNCLTSVKEMKKILAIDDNKDNLTSIKALIENFMPKCTVLTAQSGTAGISVARRELPDTILLDIIMPKMDGYEVCTKLKHDKATQHIPIVMLTALKTNMASRVKSLELGADAFLAKPIDPIELSAQVNAMLRVKTAEDKLRAKKVNLKKLVSIRTAKLKGSEQKYRDLFEQSADANLIIQNGKIVNCNQATLNMLQYKSKTEFLNMHPSELSPEKQPDGKLSLAKIDEMMAIALEKGSFRFEWNNKRQNGEVFPVEVLLTKLSDGKQTLHTVFRDITERKQAEQKLAEAVTMWQTTFDAMSDSVSILDNDGYLVKCNVATLKMFKISASEVKHKHYLQLIHGLAESIKNCPVVRMKKSRQAESIIIQQDNRWLEITADPIFNNTGVIIGAVHIVSDITERKQADIALHDSKQKVERLHEIAHQLEECTSEMEIYHTTIKAAASVLNFNLTSLSIAEGERLVEKISSADLATSKREHWADTEKMAMEVYRTGINNLLVSPRHSGIIAAIKDIGIFRVYSTENATLNKEDMRLLELLMGHTEKAIKRLRQQNKINEQTIHDPLTKLYNKRYFDYIIEQENRRANRYKHQIGFIMVDIDRFKQINNIHGHPIGDKVLQYIANLLINQVRDTDIVVRYGGDEFLIVLIEPDKEISMVKQRIMTAVSKSNQTKSMMDFPVTLSIGVAHWTPTGKKSLQDTLAEAARKLYEVKNK